MAAAAQSLTPPANAEAIARRWFALYIVRNHEKRVDDHLRNRELESFLPLYSITRRWKNRVNAKLELPLFPGYVFVRIADSERVRVLQVPGVVSIIGNGRELLPLPDVEIETLRRGIGLRQVDPHPFLQVGNRVRICSGPFAGLTGIVIRRDSKLRVVLSLELIQRSVAVHVTSDEVEPL